jgi:hypothetical protein
MPRSLDVKLVERTTSDQIVRAMRSVSPA